MIFPESINFETANPDLRLAREARGKGEYTKSLTHLTKAIKACPQDPGLIEEVQQLAGQVGQLNGLLQKLSQHVTVVESSGPSACESETPAIFFNALPKSASDYISDALIKGLNLNHLFAVTGVFPNKLLRRDAIGNFARGSLIYDHVNVSTFNLALLNKHLDRMIVHVRDPRQALLSWTHHLRQRHERNDEVLIFYQFTDGYYSWSFERQLDWQIENYFHHFIDWTEGWLAADENPDFKPDIFFSTFEGFRGNERRYFESLLRFFGIDFSAFTFPETTLPSRAHFRAGSTDEWRQMFTKNQLSATSAMISLRATEKFGWSRS